jgi:hypothetical protein
MKRNR